MKRPFLIFLIFTLLVGAFIPEDAYAKKSPTRSTAKTEKQMPRTRSTVNTEKEKNKKEITKTQEELKANRQKINQQMTQLNSIRADIEVQTAQIDRLNDSIIEINTQIASVSDSLRKLNKSIDVLTKAYADNLRTQRHRRISLNDLTFIFSSETFTQAFSRMRYLGKLSTAQTAKAQTIKAQKKALEQKRDRLSQLRKRHERAQNQLAEAREVKERQQEQTEKIVDQLKKDGKGLQAYLDERKRVGQLLEQELQRIIQEEIRAEEQRRKAEEKRLAEQRRKEEEKRKAEEKRLAEERRKAEEAKSQADNSQGGSASSSQGQAGKKDDKAVASTTPSSSKDKGQASTGSSTSSSSGSGTKSATASATSTDPLTAAFEKKKGSLLFPCTGSHKIISRFGIGSHPTNPNIKIQNNGIDILATPGAKACAIFEGEVSNVMRLGDFNPYAIFVRHGNYFAVYSNISQPLVRKGDKVTAGQGLGTIYTDPDIKDSTQLHFEIHSASPNKKLDPLLWVKG